MNRRDFLEASSILVPAAYFGAPPSGNIQLRAKAVGLSESDRKEFIAKAVDAAISAGASYADARLTHNAVFRVGAFTSPHPSESMSFGVRALFKGYWGFASGPVWSDVEAVRLGNASVIQAKANVLGREREVELAPIQTSSESYWETPVKDDPFKINYYELDDYCAALRSFILTLKLTKNPNVSLEFKQNLKYFGNSVNQFNSQLIRSTAGNIGFEVENKSTGRKSATSIDEVSIAGAGFEYLRDRPIREFIRRAHEEALQDLDLQILPIDPGRFETLLDQKTIAHLLVHSIGKATQVDRVYGYEANAGGTSYIKDPISMLGSLKVGSPDFTVVSDRSQLGSVGRVMWDDEGVSPSKSSIVDKGILSNLQTNREGASWISDYYSKNNQPVQSSGSAYSESALDVQLVHLSDLSMKPGTVEQSRDDLRSSMDSGIEFRTPTINIDFQQISGWSQSGKAYEIRKGKRSAIYLTAGILFRTTELWNNIIALGGAKSVEYFGLKSEKGQPEQSCDSGVYAPPAIFKDMTVVDISRKA